MAKRNYELMFIVDPELGEDNTAALLERIRGYLEEADTTLVTLDEWGLRRLAYRIKGQRDGRYFLAYFSAEPQKVGAIERRLRLVDGLIRQMITRFEGEMPKPKAVTKAVTKDVAETVAEAVAETVAETAPEVPPEAAVDESAAE